MSTSEQQKPTDKPLALRDRMIEEFAQDFAASHRRLTQKIRDIRSEMELQNIPCDFSTKQSSQYRGLFVGAVMKHGVASRYTNDVAATAYLEQLLRYYGSPRKNARLADYQRRLRDNKYEAIKVE